MGYEPIPLTICPQCSKEFVKAPQSVFKNYCSWHCLCERRKGVARNTREVEAKPSKTCRAVIQYMSHGGDEVARHPSIKSAAKAVGGSSSTICLACQGKLPHAYGYGWKYEKDGRG